MPAHFTHQQSLILLNVASMPVKNQASPTPFQVTRQAIIDCLHVAQSQIGRPETTSNKKAGDTPQGAVLSPAQVKPGYYGFTS
ncbi:hypothetical protein [Enterobacter kobei]|uniref:hypothetical protein n=1 Tax=Enterobacter kobei TaxID=208224 RepID=UPI001124EBA1|nr:hypothetical protein [Enterobacter kobei]